MTEGKTKSSMKYIKKKSDTHASWRDLKGFSLSDWNISIFDKKQDFISQYVICHMISEILSLLHLYLDVAACQTEFMLGLVPKICVVSERKLLQV